MRSSRGTYFFFILEFAIFLGIFPSTSPSQSPPQAQPTDAFVGQWKFNDEKSSRKGIESKIIMIESQGGVYKLTVDSASENGVKSYAAATTSMKGEVVKTIDKNGKPTTQEWRVTREGPDAFRVEWLGTFPMQEKYEVSADGKTMTIRDVTPNPIIIAGKLDKNGKLTRVDLFEVFDKALPIPIK
jgi:hypothetical protein